MSDLPDEEWRPIPNYLDMYEVSNLARVRNKVTGRVKRSGEDGRVTLQSELGPVRRPIMVLRQLAFSSSADNLAGERWAIVEEAPKYEVSDMGRVRNRKTGRILKQFNMSVGAPTVTLMDAGWKLSRSVPKLVRAAFGVSY